MAYALSIIIFFFTLPVFGQGDGMIVYHDPTLDSINGNVAALNTTIQAYGPWLNQSNFTYSVNAIGAQQNSNAPSQFATLSNAAVAASSSIVNMLQTNLSSTDPASYRSQITNITSGTSAYNSSGTNSSILSLNSLGYGLPETIDLRLSSTLPSFQTLSSVIRGVLLGIIYFSVFLWTCSDVWKEFDKIFMQRQLEANKQSVFGWDAVMVFGAALVVLFVAVFYGAVATIFHSGWLVTAYTSSSTVFSYLHNAPQSVPGFDVATAWLPVPEIVSVLLSYWSFRLLFLRVTAVAVRTIILFCFA